MNVCLPEISKCACVRARTVHPVFVQRFGTTLLRECPGSVCHCAFSLVLSCLKRSMVVMSDCVSNGVQFSWIGLFLFAFHLFFISV